MEIEKIMQELFSTGIALYILSIFISAFDEKIGYLLKKIAHINLFSFIFLIVIQIWMVFIKFTDVLEKISEWKLF